MYLYNTEYVIKIQRSNFTYYWSVFYNEKIYYHVTSLLKILTPRNELSKVTSYNIFYYNLGLFMLLFSYLNNLCYSFSLDKEWNFIQNIDLLMKFKKLQFQWNLKMDL